VIFAAAWLASAAGQNNGTETNDWRLIQEGVDGYPAGHMLEIALRRTQDDKMEMFKWRSEFITMLGVQSGPLVEREWNSQLAWPPLTGAGTWTGMTWWENQQSWHDMANMSESAMRAAGVMSGVILSLAFASSFSESSHSQLVGDHQYDIVSCSCERP